MNILLISQWNQHPRCRALMRNQQFKLLWPEVNVLELTPCMKLTCCWFMVHTDLKPFFSSTFQGLLKDKSHFFKDLFSTQFDMHVINPQFKWLFVCNILQRNVQCKQEIANVVQEIKSQTSENNLIVYSFSFSSLEFKLTGTSKSVSSRILSLAVFRSELAWVTKVNFPVDSAFKQSLIKVHPLFFSSF